MDIVDFRRFRTWDSPSVAPGQPTWRIFLRYGYLRLAANWPGRILLILLGLSTIISVGTISYGLASGSGISGTEWSGTMLHYLYPLAAVLLLVAGPLFADDIRFNAPLFYFSKPLRPRDYLVGKLAFLGSLVALVAVVPVLLLLVLAFAVGIPAGQPEQCSQFSWYCGNLSQAAYNAQWSQTHVDTFAEGLAATAATLPGYLLVIAMFTTLALVCSAYTARGWHAAMAFIALVGGTSLAGSVLQDSIDGAMGHLASPLGWVVLLIVMPTKMMFMHDDPNRWELLQVQGAAQAIPLAYLLAALTTAAAAYLLWRRLARQEARL